MPSIDSVAWNKFCDAMDSHQQELEILRRNILRMEHETQETVKAIVAAAKSDEVITGSCSFCGGPLNRELSCKFQCAGNGRD